jgi:hypothetical protein
MVFVPNGRGGGWYEPPYTWEEEMDMYRRMNAGPMTIYHDPRKAADKPATQESPQHGENEL